MGAQRLIGATALPLGSFSSASDSMLLIQVASQAASRSLRAARIQRTGTAVSCRSFIHGVTVFVIGVLAQQSLGARTDVRIGFRFVAKVCAAEQSAIPLIIHCAHDRNVRHYARRLTMSYLPSIGVTC